MASVVMAAVAIAVAGGEELESSGVWVGETMMGPEAMKMTRDDGCTEKGRERLWVLVNRKASGSCQPLWTKGPDTHARRANHCRSRDPRYSRPIQVL